MIRLVVPGVWITAAVHRESGTKNKALIDSPDRCAKRAADGGKGGAVPKTAPHFLRPGGAVTQRVKLGVPQPSAGSKLAGAPREVFRTGNGTSRLWITHKSALIALKSLWTSTRRSGVRSPYSFGETRAGGERVERSDIPSEPTPSEHRHAQRKARAAKPGPEPRADRRSRSSMARTHPLPERACR